MSAKAAKAKKPTIAERILQRERALEAGKASYQLADQLLEELEKEMEIGKSVDLGNGQAADLVDNFAVKRKQWKPAGFTRFDIKISRAKDVVAKL